MLLGAVLAMTAPAVRSDQIVTDNINFATNNQSLWAPDIPNFNYNWRKDLSWNSGAGKIGWSLIGASYDFTGDVGAKFNAYCDAGTVNIAYPITFTMDYPSQSALVDGGWFPVKSSYAYDAVGMNTTPPAAGASADVFFNANTSINVTSSTFGVNESLVPSFLQNVDLDYPIFNTGSLLNYSGNPQDISLFNGEITAVFNVPNLTASTKTLVNGTQLDANATDTFLTVEGHLSDALSECIGIPLSDELDFGALGTEAAVGYDLLDFRANIDVDLIEALQFEPITPHVYQAYSYPTWFQTPAGNYKYGTEIDFDAGQSYNVLMPPVPENIVTTYVLPHPIFSNVTSIGIQPSLQFVPFEIYANAEIAYKSLFNIDFEPFDWSIGTGSLFTIPVYQDTWSMPGTWVGVGQKTTLSYVDAGPPVTTIALTGKGGNSGWFRGPVTAALSATDPDGRIAIAATYYKVDSAAKFSKYSAPFHIAGDGTHVVNYYSVNDEGATETTKQQTVNIDGTPPALVWGTPSPAPNSSGWNNTSVTLTDSTSDATSGVAASTPASPLTFETQGYGLTKTVKVIDAAGNEASFKSPAINIDTTPPTTTATVAGTALPAGGTVTLAATDKLSGVATTYYIVDAGAAGAYTAPFNVPGAGEHVVDYWSVDNAGNIENKHSVSFTNAVVAPPPTLLSLNPTTAVAGAATLTLTVNGANFQSGAVVTWAGMPLTTTFVSNSVLTASVASTLLTNAGTVAVSVVNSDGQKPFGPSNLPFTIDPSF
jgi:hypothetical protein